MYTPATRAEGIFNAVLTNKAQTAIPRNRLQPLFEPSVRSYGAVREEGTLNGVPWSRVVLHVGATTQWSGPQAYCGKPHKPWAALWGNDSDL